jgi:hypothetical protein
LRVCKESVKVRYSQSPASADEIQAAYAIIAEHRRMRPLDINILNNCPPIPPPTSPAIEFPIGPKLKFFNITPAMLPTTAPLIIWMIKASIVLSSFQNPS